MLLVTQYIRTQVEESQTLDTHEEISGQNVERQEEKRGQAYILWDRI